MSWTDGHKPPTDFGPLDPAGITWMLISQDNEPAELMTIDGGEIEFPSTQTIVFNHEREA